MNGMGLLFPGKFEEETKEDEKTEAREEDEKTEATEEDEEKESSSLEKICLEICC